MTLKSMTSFGRAELSTPFGSYRCEIKTLNSRFIDASIKMPRTFMALETEVIGMVKQALKRGKVDVLFDIRPTSNSDQLPAINLDAIAHYLNEQQKVLQVGGQGPLNIAQLFQLEGVLKLSKQSSEDQLKTHQEPILKVVKLALEQVIEGREKEGLWLQSALLSLLKTLKQEVATVEALSKDIQIQLFEQVAKKVEALMEKLSSREKAQALSVSPDRLAQEVALLADKMDITEEITRLQSHCMEFDQLVHRGHDIGRKLDFFCQEMHREVNTISNKLSGVQIVKHSLEIKQIIEKIRQQVQNIE